MLIFTISKHAEVRMKERNIPSPIGLKLIAAGKKKRKAIRVACEKNGLKNEWGSNYVYFVNGNYVFVCIIEDIAKYKVVTAFELIKQKL
jgi:hypothetical protein